MKNTVIIFVIIIAFMGGFIILNKVCDNFTGENDEKYDIQMTQCQVFCFDYKTGVKNNILFHFSSEKCDFSNNFRNMDAKGNIKGDTNFNNSNITFVCDEISFAQREKILTAKNIKAFLNPNIGTHSPYIYTTFGYIDLNSMYLKSPKEIIYKSKETEAKSTGCYADLKGKVLVLNKATLFTDFDINKI